MCVLTCDFNFRGRCLWPAVTREVITLHQPCSARLLVLLRLLLIIQYLHPNSGWQMFFLIQALDDKHSSSPQLLLTHTFITQAPHSWLTRQWSVRQVVRLRSQGAAAIVSTRVRAPQHLANLTIHKQVKVSITKKKKTSNQKKRKERNLRENPQHYNPYKRFSDNQDPTVLYRGGLL